MKNQDNFNENKLERRQLFGKWQGMIETKIDMVIFNVEKISESITELQKNVSDINIKAANEGGKRGAFYGIIIATFTLILSAIISYGIQK